jgi:DNA-binding transcriptional regulator YhcF (GntR family)
MNDPNNLKKAKHVVVSEQTHQLLQMYKSRTGSKTLEQVIIDFMKLEADYEQLKNLIHVD